MAESSQSRITVQVQPGARRSEVVGRHGDAWKLKVAAPPVEGKANDEVLSLLAKVLGVRRRDISIVRGHTGRRKLVEIAGLSDTTVEERLTDI